jgi:DNA repair protein RecO (recombination protein O)
MITKSEAIILKAMKYRESSKILTLYTREYGKLSVIAKGARDPKSKFGSALEPMNYVFAVFYKKENRELHLLTQCDLMKSFRHLSEDMERLHAAMAIVELVDAVSHSEERNEPLFRTTVESLEEINRATKNALQVLYLFEMRLSGILGFRPNFHTCFNCGRSMDAKSVGPKGAELHLNGGGVFCVYCTHKALGQGTISLGALKVLQRLQDIEEIGAVTRISLSSQVRTEVAGTLRRFLQNHVDGLHRLKAEEVFAAIA